MTSKQQETYQKWKDNVNMTKSELQKFYDSDEGKKAGLSPKEANRQGIDYGRESARWILKMKDTPVSEWTDAMWKWAGKQNSFISRMSGMEGKLYNDKGVKTRKHLSLLIWGHNPEKKAKGGKLSSLEKIKKESESLINIEPEGLYEGGLDAPFFKKGGITIAQTPAPAKDRIYGSKVNKRGSAESKKTAKDIKFSPKVIESLNKKVSEFNESNKDKVDLETLKAVYRRGAGAYSVSHRPTITGGVPNTRNAWAMARVNKFLKKKAGEKVKLAYVQDDDLLAKGGTTKTLLAPNGQPSNLTPEQWHLVRTPEFKAWFGDWENDPKNASKVVDENGEPLICYHGTLQKFNVFNTYFDNDTWHGKGAYFTSSLKDLYTNYVTYKEDIYLICFLNLKNPLIVGKKDESSWFEKKDREIILKYLRLFRFPRVNYAYENSWDSENLEKIVRSEFPESQSGKLLNTIYRELGFDGIIFLSPNKLKGHKAPLKTKHFVAFQPNQIKLADGSNTTFDANNSDIRFAKGGSTSILLAPNGQPSNLTPEQWHQVRTPEFKNWFGDWENDPENASKVVDENGEPMIVYRGFNSKSDAGNVFRFGINRFKNNRKANRFAHYFTRSKNVAKEYAEQGEKKNEKDIIVKSYFLKCENLADLTKNNPKYPTFNEWALARESFMEFSNYELLQKLKRREIPIHSYLFESVLSKAKNEDDIDELTELKIKEVEKKIKSDEKELRRVYDSSDDINLFHLIKMISGKKLDEVLNQDYNLKDAESKREIFEWFINYKQSDVLVIEDLDLLLKELFIDNNFDGGKFNEFQFGVKKPTDKEVYFVFNPTQIKLADGSNTTFDPNNPDIRYEQGGEVDGLISQGIVELSMFETDPKHAKEYGFESKKPLFIQRIFIAKDNRQKGIGSMVLSYIIDYAIKNEHDVIFGNITQKAEPNIDVIKSMLIKSGYNTCEGNNDFYKILTDTKYESNNPKITFASGGLVLGSRRKIPNVRGGWTKEKIINYFKSYGSDTTSTYTLVKYISEFDNWQQFKDHIFYHGTQNYIDKGLKPSITMSERDAERYGGGGYGQRYFGISLTKRKRIAESFAGMSRSVTIYPVILKKDAKVIERTDLEDASEIEDIIVELYEQGVDAVWIGGGEEELVVVNPYSVLLYKNGAESHQVFGGFKSIPLTDEKIKEIYDNSIVLWEKYSQEYKTKNNKEEKEQFLNSLPRIKFAKGGTTKTLLAPNGQPSNLTPDQYRLVRTPEFKNWFGDWENDPENASKVVDENGEPLVVYHGTTKEFNIFNLNYAKSQTKVDWGELGFFFTPSKELAFDFTRHKWSSQKSKFRKGSRVIECFISIINPKKITATKFVIPIKSVKEYKDESLKMNFDGWVIEKFNDDDRESWIRLFGLDSVKEFDYNQFVVFHPNQIKLADGSNTTFDPNNLDIRFAKGGSTNILLAPNGQPSNLTPEQYRLVRTPEFKNWFGDWENEPQNASKVVDENGEPLICYHGSSEYGFYTFDKKKFAKNDRGDFGKGFYFTPSKGYAETYTEGDFSKIYSVFLNVKKPLLHNARFLLNDTSTILIKQKFDGILVYSDKYELPLGYVKNLTEIVVFNSKQIKLADGSNTTFSPNNPDIRFEDGGNIDLISDIKFKILNGQINSDDGAIELYESGIEVNDDLYDELRELEKRFLNKNRGLQVGDKVLIKGKNGNEDFEGNFRGYTNDGKLIVVYRGGYQMAIEKDDLKFLNGGETEYANGGEIVKDEYGNLITYENDNYRVSIDNPYSAKRVVLWNKKEGKWSKIGQLNTYVAEMRLGNDKEFKKYLKVQEVEIEKRHRGLGFGMMLYKTLIKYAGKDIDAIISYLPDRSDKKAIPKIYSKLGAKEMDDYAIVKLADGGQTPSDFSKVASASSRFRPKETINFDPPLVGTNGAKLISYTWRYEWTMLPNWEGELVEKRVSDWSQAENSAETGRDIVHVYDVIMPDGSVKSVSSESVPVLLGFVEKSQAKVFGSLATASKTLAKQLLKLSIMEAQNKEYDELRYALEKSKKPEIELASPDEYPFISKRHYYDSMKEYGFVDFVYYKMGDEVYREYISGINFYPDSLDKQKDKYLNYIKNAKPNRETVEQLTYSWISNEIKKAGVKRPYGLNDLKNKVERQKRKVERMLQDQKLEDGGFINENKNQIMDNEKTISLPDTYASESSLKRVLSEQGYELSKNDTNTTEEVNKGITISDVAKKHSVPVETLRDELNEGIKVEMEHYKNPEKSKKIALDHLMENPKFYKYLEKMEAKMNQEAIDNHYVELVDRFAKGGKISDAYSFKTPTGQKSRLEYLQQVLVRTTGFKNWFGDWQKAAANYLADNGNNIEKHYEGISKVIDFATLEPKLVFHGTRVAEEFYQFDVSMDAGMGRPYGYFADNQEYSLNFLQSSQRGQGDGEGFLYKCFLNIKKPFMAITSSFYGLRKNYEYWLDLIATTVHYDRPELSLEEIKQEVNDNLKPYFKEVFVDLDYELPFWRAMSADKESIFKRYLLLNKYDGIRYAEEYQSNYDITNPAEFTEAWTIFSPKQVKLGDGRNIDFNPFEVDIRMKNGGKLENPQPEIIEMQHQSKSEKMRAEMGMEIEPMNKFGDGGSVYGDGAHTRDAKDGGFFKGKSHADGGIKAVNIDTGQIIEVEGNEVIINKRSVADQTKREFEGEMLTNKEILSRINQMGGGVKFEKGGNTAENCGCSGKKYKFGGEILEDYIILARISKMSDNSPTPKEQGIRQLDELIKRIYE